MKIAFYSPENDLNKTRGIGFYTKNLIESLSKLSLVDISFFSNYSKLKNIDLVHYPYFDFFKISLPFSKRFPIVITIHDVIPLIFPQHYPPGIKGKIKHNIQKFLVNKIDAVITDSESSKKDVEKYLGINNEKIHVIYLAPGLEFKKINDEKRLLKTKKKYDLPYEYILYAGNVNWNKNLLNMVESVLLENKNLVLVGKSFEQKESLNHPELRDYKKFLEKYADNEKIKILGYVETDELVDIYNLSKCVIFASFYEGFGLPILEAQACEVPVITSNVASMPEVAGKGAILVQPEKVEDLRKAIKTIFSDKKYVNELIKAGKENLKRFTWDKTAANTLEVYKNVLKIKD